MPPFQLPHSVIPGSKVLIGCETSGVVDRAFAARGFDTWSCDLNPAEDASNHHIIGDIRDVMMMDDWSLMAVMHPPCTRLTNSGVRWLHVPPPGRTLDEMWAELEAGAALFSDVWNVPHIPHVAVENPVMHKHAKALVRNFQPATQSVQPCQFGHDPDGPDNLLKRTCFWLRNLPPLVPTGTLDGSTDRDDIYRASPGPDRARIRSRFFPGLAGAMATQWDGYSEAVLKAA